MEVLDVDGPIQSELGDTRLYLRFWRERYVHSHLVAVEVGVERSADQRVYLYCLALYEHRLERLYAEAVQRGSAIEKHWMLADNFFQYIPGHGLLLFNHLFGLLDSRGVSLLLELVIDKRLEEFQGHLLRQTALVQMELRTDHDNGTAGIVYALA